MRTIIRIVLIGMFGLCIASCQKEEIFPETVKPQLNTKTYAIDDHDLCKGDCK